MEELTQTATVKLTTKRYLNIINKRRWKQIITRVLFLHEMYKKGTKASAATSF
jgi:hypothetical protein